MSIKGITLVALVVTIVVLLILAGVTINLVLSDEGIFKKAEQAEQKHNQAKARESLELVLSKAQIQKYEGKLTDEELNNQINKIGELLPKEDENSNNQQVIVDGYIFEIDRSVPKIIEEIGPADGIFITAYISGNNGWVKPSEANVSIKGKIVTYSGGNITKATVNKGENAQNDLILTDSNYIIENITENTTIVINAEDSKGNRKTKTIPIEIKMDETAPTIDEIAVEVKGMKIKISATGNDKNINGQEESGINYFTYSITSTDDNELNGIPENKRTGTFKLNEKIEIDVLTMGREETTYNIAIIAEDNVKNQSAKTSKTIKVEEGRSRKTHKNKGRRIKKG